MNPRRRSTVHDLAALRLHRDGTRVLNSDTNRSSRRAKYAVRDARGNWIAQDAGGLGNVKQRRSASRPEDDGDVRESEEDEEVAEEAQTSPKKDKGKGKAREDEVSEEEHEPNPRARKRRRFDEDLSYLASGSSPALVPPAEHEEASPAGGEHLPGALPVPSSDLLKCLHYFASTYYSAMGQLYDGSREFRQQRRARKLAKATSTTGSTGPRRTQSEGVDAPDSRDSDEENEPTDDELDLFMDDSASENDPAHDDPTVKKDRKKRPRQLRPTEKDMYKIFDGSALMALGMLFQEHVAETLEPRVPDGWEKQMALVDRERKAEIRRSRQAQRMREKRHSAKGSQEVADTDAGFDPDSGGDEARSVETETESGDEGWEDVGRPPERNLALKQSSSVPLLSSSDGSDD